MLTKIFVVDDDVQFTNLLNLHLKRNNNYEIELYNSGTELLSNLHKCPDIITLDYNMPDYNGFQLYDKIKQFNEQINTIFISGQKDVNIVVEAYKKGITNYIVKGEEAIVELLNSIKNISTSISLKRENEILREQIIERNRYNNIIGESQAILKVIKSIQKVEKNNITTLITGESGTGKEVVAKAIHYNSDRKKKNFVPVNISAIPADLIESELFGHEKGAFTGAEGKRIGKFEEADGGTIFLDEIGEMELSLQSKLLRVLQENTITRLGSNKEIKLDVRVITATNKNLKELVASGKFREDLYYRIQGFPINLPALKERENDIIILSKYFIEQFCSSNKIKLKSISKIAFQKILEYSWPGNVRELKAFIERSILISENDIIDIDDLLFA